MSKRNKWILIVVGIVVVIGIVGAAASSKKSKAVDPVAITLQAHRVGADVVVEGTASVPDGALLAYQVSHDYGSEPLPTDAFIVEGNIEVRGGKYSTRVASVPAGKTEVWVAFQTILGAGAKQPAAVIDTYGDLGQNIKGDVTHSGNFKRVEKSVVID